MSSHSRTRRAGAAAISALTWIVIAIFVFPILWMVLTSFKPESLAATTPPTIFAPPTFDRYVEVFERGIAPYLVNSLTASAFSTVVVLVLAIPAGYALSVRRIIRWRDAMFFFLSTRFMPAAASVIPLYIVLQTLGLLDNVSALAVIYVVMNLPIAIWMMRSFFAELPSEIMESAQVDGAGYGTELVRIAMPLVAPGIAAVALICFIFSWNEYFYASLLTSNAARTAPTFLAALVSPRGQFLAMLSAACTIVVLPVLVAGWSAQKQLVRGLTLGAVK